MTKLSEAQDMAQKVIENMLGNDLAAQALAIGVEKVAPGYALLTMTVRQDMLNGHGTCHGGMCFTLADTAFAFACNSHNIANVLSGCSFEMMAPGQLGDKLRAEAVEISLGRRTGLYDIKVTNQDGVAIAFFRGRCVSLNRPVINS
jgi:acyl-CoA thioesterase